MDITGQKPQSGANSRLASTALWTASVRAMETARPDHLFEDPWAADLAGLEGQDWIAGRTPDKVIPIVLRTRYFDDFLIRTVRDHSVQQVVLVAAGLDTRAFRLDWPAPAVIFEIDQPSVLEHKQSVLSAAGAQSTCERRVIQADLTQPWAESLLAAGYNRQAASVWLLEGFLFYLPCETIESILDEVTGLAGPGSWLGFDIVNSATLTHPLTRPWVEMQAAAGAPWTGMMDDPAAFLARRGWKAALSQAGQPDANHGRWPFPVIPVELPGFPHNWFVTAQLTSRPAP